jgi:hypothetical protein
VGAGSRRALGQLQRQQYLRGGSVSPTSGPTGRLVRSGATQRSGSQVRAGPRRRWPGRWVGAGSQAGRWVEYTAGNIRRLAPRVPAPGGPAVFYGLLARGATTRPALGGPAVAVEGAGSPNAPTQRALGRESCPLGLKPGAAPSPSRSPSPSPPPLFLPPSPAAATAATRPEKNSEGRWVLHRALGART